MKKGKTNKMQLTWGSTAFDDPYQVIRAIFGFADTGFYRHFIRDILLYSTRKKRYKKEHASNIIFLLDGIVCLLSACFIISKEKKHSLLEVEEEDIIKPDFYSLRNAATDLWSDFPRSLTKAEMLDPYTVFGKVFQHYTPDKWYHLMKYFTEDACGNYSDVYEENTLLVYIQLTRLFEAAHLINVREIAHVRNWRSNTHEES